MKTRSYSNAKSSRFTKVTRIDPTQLAWLQQHKDTRTVAGFLDKIINHYKQHHGP